MTEDTPDTPEEKPAEKAQTEEPPTPQEKQTETVVEKQPEPAQPKTGLAAVAAVVNATAPAPTTGKEPGGEGAGLFFPSADKIRERQKAKKAASDTPKATAPAETEPQPDTPNAEQPADDEEAAPEPEPAEEQVAVQRPPPPPTPEAVPHPQPSPKTDKKKKPAGNTGIVAYMAPYKDANGDTRYQLNVYNLTLTDARKIEWMSNYLCDVQHYIPVAHPSYLMKFMFNFLMQAIKEEFYENNPPK